MAGIGFTLKKMFGDETFTNRGKAYLYSALVAAGPWIAAVITVNTIIFIMGFAIRGTAEKELFMGTIVYSFVFSQIITAPWQLIITRYISDQLYNKNYEAIRPSFVGLNKIVFILVFIISALFYFGKPLPFYYKLMGIYLFIIITIIWILMVYLSASKNYELIAKAYIFGGFLSIGLTIYFSYNPLPFPALVHASNLLFAYLVGLSLTFLLLLHNFLSTFYFGNHLEYDFLRYLNKVPSVFFVGLFYVSGLWIDDIVMWFSPVGVEVYDTYLYAPIYDNAVFLAYLTIIPSMVLFLVAVETEFYDYYKNYYGLANNTGTYREIEAAKKEMEKTIYRQLLRTFEIQSLISITILLLSAPIFDFLNISTLIRDIFRVCVLGALFNIFAFLIILVLLYFEVRKRAVLLSLIFFLANLVLTRYYVFKGLEYYGYGFLLGSLLTLIIAMVFLGTFMKKLNFATFALQPLFPEIESGLFVRLADALNRYKQKQYEARKVGMEELKRVRNRRAWINIGITFILIAIYIAANAFDAATKTAKSTPAFKEVFLEVKTVKDVKPLPDNKQ